MGTTVVDEPKALNLLKPFPFPSACIYFATCTHILFSIFVVASVMVFRMGGDEPVPYTSTSSTLFSICTSSSHKDFTFSICSSSSFSLSCTSSYYVILSTKNMPDPGQNVVASSFHLKQERQWNMRREWKRLSMCGKKQSVYIPKKAKERVCRGGISHFTTRRCYIRGAGNQPGGGYFQEEN